MTKYKSLEERKKRGIDGDISTALKFKPCLGTTHNFAINIQYF
jgi:hypothetical protein